MYQIVQKISLFGLSNQNSSCESHVKFHNRSCESHVKFHNRSCESHGQFPCQPGPIFSLLSIMDAIWPMEIRLLERNGKNIRQELVTWGENGRNRLSEGYIAARMAAVKQTPVNAAEIERQFRLLAENPAIRTVAANLQPGARPGEAQLAIKARSEFLANMNHEH